MSDFPQTVWTQIRRAGAGRETAVATFVSRYRPAVLRFLRRRGLDAARAEDVAQEVFLRVFDDKVLERADAARGRFRSLLLAVTRHVLSHDLERASARKRGGGRSAVALDDAALETALASESRDDEFDREWLASLLALALAKLRSENETHHACLEAFLVEERSHKEVAEKLGKTEATVRNAISRGKARLAAILRESIAGYASSDEEVRDEVRYLSRFLEAPKE